MRGRAPRSAAPARVSAPESVGSWLGGQRRLRGLSLEDVVELTRIPRRSLERLEAGAFDGNVDGFARGFVRAVAEAIGVDPEEANARLLGEARPERTRRALPWRPIVLAVLASALAFVSIRTLPLWHRAPARPALPAPTAAPASPGLARRDYVRELAARTPPAPPPAPEQARRPTPRPSP